MPDILKNSNFRYNHFIWLVLLPAIILSGCKKDDISLGGNLIPGSDIINSRSYQEKGTISAFTYTDEKVRVDRPDYCYTGSFNDPLFGRTDGSFAAQFRILSHPDFDATSTTDSLILQMSYKLIYGDTLTAQTLRVYELNEGLKYDAKYMSSFDIKSLASSTLLGSTTFIPRFRTDSTQNDTTEQVLKIKINPLLAAKLMMLDSLEMISNDIFLTKFKGLYIETDQVNRKGTLVGIQPLSTALQLHYHTALKDSLSFVYKVTSNSTFVAGFDHDFTKSAFYPNMNQETVQDSLIFLQPLGGTKIKVNIPSLANWKDSSDYLINRASVTFRVDTLLTDMRRYEIPARVYLKYIDENDDEVFPEDSQLANSYYGGYYNPLTATYSFNIKQHLQKLIKKEVDNTSFYLVNVDRKGVARRVVLKGGTSATPIELQVNYTRYKE